jgi:hypothetical protein
MIQNGIKTLGKVLSSGNISTPRGKNRAMDVGLRVLDYAATSAMVLGAVVTLVKLCNILVSPETSRGHNHR